MKETSLDRKILAEPWSFAVLLDKKHNCERVIVGKRSEILLRMRGGENETVFYDKTRPLGSLLLDFQEQSAQEWNSSVHYPLTQALKSVFHRKELEEEAWCFLERALCSDNPISIFTAQQCWCTYERCRAGRGDGDFQNAVMYVTRPFGHDIMGSQEKQSVSASLKQVEGILRTTRFSLDAGMEMWYGGKKWSGGCAVFMHSFYPIILHYLQHLKAWGLVFCKCSNCGKMFLAPSGHHALCSQECHRERNRQLKREFDQRAKVNGYDTQYKNVTQRMRSRMKKVNGTSVATEDKEYINNLFDAFRKDALQRKKKVRSGDEIREFCDWLFEEERRFERACQQIEQKNS